MKEIRAFYTYPYGLKAIRITRNSHTTTKSVRSSFYPKTHVQPIQSIDKQASICQPRSLASVSMKKEVTSLHVYWHNDRAIILLILQGDVRIVSVRCGQFGKTHDEAICCMNEKQA